MMARPLRIEYPGAFYHVIHRGNAGEAIFKSQRDHERFLEYLSAASQRYALRLHTYCLMTNHYHLLVETPQANLSQAVKWINVSYAAYFNRKRQRHGHLFQGRYKAILIDAEAYLKQLSRYIHLNPLRAKMVKRLEDHRWSSYRAFIGKSPSPGWLETEWLLSLFAKQRRRAMRHYQRFVESVDGLAMENPENDMIGGFLLGGDDFVDWVKASFFSQKSAASKNNSQWDELDLQPSLGVIVDAVCDEFNCEGERVIRKGRKNNTARDLAIYLARELTGKSNVLLGDYFGQISGAGITMRSKHMAQQLRSNRRLKERASRIRRQIINN
jgi:REP element-mobilizing transposase RayT